MSYARHKHEDLYTHENQKAVDVVFAALDHLEVIVVESLGDFRPACLFIEHRILIDRVVAQPCRGERILDEEWG